MAARKALTPGQKRRGKRQRQQAAHELYAAEVRTYVVGRVVQGADPVEIARELGVRKQVVTASIERTLARIEDSPEGPEERFPEDLPWRPGPKTGPGPGPHVKGSTKTGEVLDSPDEIAFRKRAFALRKRALPFDEIAEHLGRSESECRIAVKRHLAELEDDELSDARLARRMMVAQLDAMIAAITLPATGVDEDGNPRTVVLDAIDRMCRLLDQKAKLLGLFAPQRVDITHRLETLAEETGYDIEELKRIAANVLKRYTAAGRLAS